MQWLTRSLPFLQNLLQPLALLLQQLDKLNTSQCTNTTLTCSSSMAIKGLYFKSNMIYKLLMRRNKVFCILWCKLDVGCWNITGCNPKLWYFLSAAICLFEARSTSWGTCRNLVLMWSQSVGWGDQFVGSKCQTVTQRLQLTVDSLAGRTARLITSCSWVALLRGT